MWLLSRFGELPHERLAGQRPDERREEGPEDAQRQHPLVLERLADHERHHGQHEKRRESAYFK